jgi:hypothetical protein
MSDLTENLTIRCSPVDLEIIERLRQDRSRSALLRTLLRRAAQHSAGIAAMARDAGIGDKNADLLAALAVRRGLWQVEEDAE